jgi:hypothetical protein
MRNINFIWLPSDIRYLEDLDGADYIDKVEIYLYDEDNDNNEAEVEGANKMFRLKRTVAGMKRIKTVGNKMFIKAFDDLGCRCSL